MPETRRYIIINFAKTFVEPGRWIVSSGDMQCCRTAQKGLITSPNEPDNQEAKKWFNIKTAGKRHGNVQSYPTNQQRCVITKSQLNMKNRQDHF